MIFRFDNNRKTSLRNEKPRALEIKGAQNFRTKDTKALL